MFTEQEQWTRCPSKKPTWSFFSCYFSHRVGFISFNQWCLHLKDTSQPPLLLSRKKKWKLFSLLGNIQTFFDSLWVLARGTSGAGCCPRWVPGMITLWVNDPHTNLLSCQNQQKFGGCSPSWQGSSMQGCRKDEEWDRLNLGQHFFFFLTLLSAAWCIFFARRCLVHP